MESSPFGRPVSQEQLDAREKQGVHDKDKAKAMAHTGGSERNTARILREAARGNLKSVQGHHMESQIMAILKDSSPELARRQLMTLAKNSDDLAETYERSAGQAYDVKKENQEDKAV